VLPTYNNDEVSASLPAKDVTKVALRLKYQIEQVVPCELDESDIINPNSSIITNDVIRTAEAAGGEQNRSCVIFCLLVCSRWFRSQADTELWDASLLECRAVACEVIAKHMYVVSLPYSGVTR